MITILIQSIKLLLPYNLTIAFAVAPPKISVIFSTHPPPKSLRVIKWGFTFP